MKEGWEYKKLGEVCELKRGLTYAGGDEVPMSDNCVLRSNNVNLDTMALDLSELKYLRPDFNIPSDKKVKKDSILICMSNGSKKHIGKVAFIDKEMDFAFGGFMGLIIPDNDTCPKYIYFGCRSTLFKKFLDGIGEGANIKNLRFQDLEKFSIPLPPLSEQQSIVAELDKINEIIDLKKAQLKDLDLLAQSIFYDMFGDPIENTKGWEVKKLGEVCKVGTGSTPNRKRTDYYDGLIPWVKSTEVANCRIDKTEEYISDIAIKETNCSLYPKGTLLMAMYGQGRTRGQLAILDIDATTNQAVAAILPNEYLNIDYLYQYLHLQYDNIRSMARGGNQANLNLSLVKSISIPLPPLSLQQSFASKIQAIESQKSAIKQSLAEAETLLASRMDYWFG